MSLINKDIRFPTHHYIGMVGRKEDGVPLAFMTEDGTDAAATKRKGTVDTWVKRHSNALPAKSYENKPLVGFRLDREIKRSSSWGQGNVKWRIEDPRGFGLEISSPNMAKIIDTCVLDNGEILGACIWARLKGDNVLVPVDSDLYRATVENSERMSKNVPLGQVNIGDHVILKNGDKGRYMGKMFHMVRKHSRRGEIDLPLPYVWEDKASYILITDSDRILETKSISVSEITQSDEISATDAEQIVNQIGSAIYSVKKVPLGPVIRQEHTYTEPVDRYLLAIVDGAPVLFNAKPPYYRDRYTFYDLLIDSYNNGLIRVRTRKEHQWGASYDVAVTYDKPKADFDPSQFQLEGFEMQFTTTGGKKCVLPL